MFNNYKVVLELHIGSKIQPKSHSIKKKEITVPALAMDEFLEGRKNEEAYTVFF